MTDEQFGAEIDALARAGTWDLALARILARFDAESGTIHMLGDDGALHLKAATAGFPDAVLNVIRVVPVGKGMAGLAVERREPINSCNIQTDASGDVRPGAKATGLQGSVVVPIFRDGAAVGALGIATHRARTFTDAETTTLLEIARRL